MTIGGIVLAAGASRRAACAKALATIEGETLIARAIRTLREGGVSDLIVVVGPPHGAAIAQGVREAEAEISRKGAKAQRGEESEVDRDRDGGDLDLCALAPLRETSLSSAITAENLDPARGMLSSLRIGIALADRDGWRGAVVSLVDHPRVRASTVREIVAAFDARGASVVRPHYLARGGHPFLVGRAAFAALLGAPEGDTVRTVLASIADREDVEVDDPAIRQDADTPRELARAGARVTT